MKKSKFEQQIQQWKEDVAKQCHQFAQEINLDFYPFQSLIKHKPKLMIIGANPMTFVIVV